MHTFIHFVEQIPLHNDVSMIHISVRGTVHATASNPMARWVVYGPATTFFTCKLIKLHVRLVGALADIHKNMKR
jgi:hypothetical protein